MTREQKLEAALRQIAMKAFRQTDIGENHAAGLSGIRDRHTFLAIRDMANEALAIPTDADTRVVSVADILTAAVDEYLLQHVMETGWHRSGRHATVRGLMVRLGLYPLLDQAIKELLYRAGLEGEDQ